MNQSPFDRHISASQFLELCDLDDIASELPTWDKWCLCTIHNIPDPPIALGNCGHPLLLILQSHASDTHTHTQVNKRKHMPFFLGRAWCLRE